MQKMSLIYSMGRVCDRGLKGHKRFKRLKCSCTGKHLSMMLKIVFFLIVLKGTYDATFRSFVFDLLTVQNSNTRLPSLHYLH